MEFNTGSERTRETKKKMRVRVMENDLADLRELGQQLGAAQRAIFKSRYGNLLELMEIQVQVHAITALAQYYDHPLRCFTFCDFQLVPTVEEYAQILDMPINKVPPYQHLDEPISMTTLAAIMRLPAEDLEDRDVWEDQRGFSLGFLVNYLQELGDEEEWEIYMDVFALTLFGIMLFPKTQRFVGNLAVNVYLAYRTRGESPVTAVLADTYLALNACNTKKRTRMVCCLPALFVWLVARFKERVVGIKCPVESVKQQRLEAKSKDEWSQYMASLTQKEIEWQPAWQQRSQLIYQCAKFLNVPLIGTRGCINYNPVLAQKQFGYPIKGAPTSFVVEPLLFLYKDGSAGEIVPRIRKAWQKKIIMGADTRIYAMNTDKSYQQWLANRVETVKLPFKPTSPTLVEEETPFEKESTEEAESEEIRRLKREIAELKDENVMITKRLKQEEEYTQKIQQDLEDTNVKLLKRDYEVDEAFSIVSKWISMHDASVRENTELLRKSHDLQRHVDDMERLVEEWEDQAKKELELRLEQEVNYSAKIIQLEESLEERQQALEHWKTRFSQLASLANGAIKDVPRMLKEADVSLMFRPVPTEVASFVEHCKGLVGLMKKMIAHNRP